ATRMTNVEVIPTGGHPAVYGEWLGAGPDRPTVLVYGHYDVQPVDPIALWQSPPFEPAIRGERLYARGATDDKGQLFLNMKALESIMAVEGRLPVNVKVIFEGEEESGSQNMDAFVRKYRDKLAADTVLISDMAFLGKDQPMIVYGLRGLAYMEVRVSGPSHDLHSGAFGGSVYNPAQWLAELIASMHDETGRITIPGFYDSVAPLSAAERAALAKVPYTQEMWQAETGMTHPWGELDYTLLERFSARPTCEVNGIWGGFQGEGSKTIIPAKAGAKISMRLVPNQNPAEIARLFTEYVMSCAPQHLTVEVSLLSDGWSCITPLDSVAIEAASQAYQAVWGVPPVFNRSGGSIPIAANFQKELGASIVLMGFGMPDEMIHAPNENFYLPNFYNGIDAVIHFYYNLAATH
ncbi:MAG: dipeptidase, partial [Anaerolineae bacterium]|nr:dipeptidase [Anaerolineae bacterium]